MDLRNKSILVVKQSSLGDIIHTLPLVHAIKRHYPGSRIGWLVQEAYGSIPAHDPAVDSVYTISISSTSDPQAGKKAYLLALQQTLAGFFRLRKMWAEKPYDLVLDLHASFRSGLFALANPGGRRIGFADARELNTLFQHHRLAIPGRTLHALDKNLLFCSYLDCPVDKEDFFLFSGEEAERQVDGFLRASAVLEQERIVYLNPAARWKTKFWPAENWAALADRLLEKGLRPVFAGSAEDVPYIITLTAKMLRRPLIAAGRLNLMETAALLKRSALYVGLDSGPMHMAAMAGVPVVALFGSTQPELVGPYGVAHRIVTAPGLDCLGCRRRSCSHMSCMKGITADMVCTSALSLLAQENCGETGSGSQPDHHHI